VLFCILQFLGGNDKKKKNNFAESMMDLYQEGEIIEHETYGLV
jgi:hypothetical protein